MTEYKDRSSKEQTNMPTDTNDVGYGKPPKHSQFKPGESGNPRGRPKKPPRQPATAREIFERPVRVNRGGKTVSMARSEAIFERICQKALNGEDDGIAAFLKLAPKLGYLEPPPKQLPQGRVGVLKVYKTGQTEEETLAEARRYHIERQKNRADRLAMPMGTPGEDNDKK